MHHHRDIVRKLVLYQIQSWKKYSGLNDAGVQFEFLRDDRPFQIALDIIGFPADNLNEFDTLGDNPGLRNDFQNAFSRDYFSDHMFGIGEEDVPEFIDWLYKQYDELILQQPHLFVKKGDDE